MHIHIYTYTHIHMDRFLNNGFMVLDTRTCQVGELGLFGSQLPLAEDLRLLWLCSLIPAAAQAWMSWRADHPILLPGSEPRRESPVFMLFIYANQSWSVQLSAAWCLLRASFLNWFTDCILWGNRGAMQATLVKLKPLLTYFVAAILLLPFLYSLASSQSHQHLSSIC